MKENSYRSSLLALAFATGLSGEVHVGMQDAIKAATVKPQPEYTAVAKQMKVAGKVELEVTINTDGTVENAKAVNGNPLLTASAVAAVKRWKFTPFTSNGQATKAVTSLIFEFKQ
jgi:protein TonB